jgi:AraC family transcriptional regulator
MERWQQRIQRAAALLVSRLDEPPSLREIAAAAAISPYHFHRVWRTMTGRTVGEMIRHLRIKEASRVLVESNDSVTEVAQLVGFATSQSFARAFRQELGVSPSSFRLRTPFARWSSPVVNVPVCGFAGPMPNSRRLLRVWLAAG